MEYNNAKQQKLEELLESKTFAELDEQERGFVLRELGSEEEYSTLRKISEALVTDKADLSPDPRILRRLRMEMKHVPTDETFLSRILNYSLPVYAVVILGILAAMAWLAIDSENPTTVIQPITQIRTDTVYVTAKPDTVYLEKIVVKYVQPSEAETYSVVRNVSNADDSDSNEGVNMKEKEELERFLVSGS
jgi:hypothetical protein